MIAPIAVALVAGAAPLPAPGGAPPPPPPPSRSALALAEAVVGPTDPKSLEEIADRLIADILGARLASRGPGCDQRLPACRAAAEAIARESAPAFAAQARRQRVRVMAFVFDARMMPEAIERSVTFLDTKAGRGFASAVADLSDGRRLPEPLRTQIFELSMSGAMPEDVSVATLAGRLHDRTRDLPRGAPLIAPPPPVSRRP